MTVHFWVARDHAGLWVSHAHVLSPDRARFIGLCASSAAGFAAWVPRPVPPDPRTVITCASCLGALKERR